jgi:hypothetical protein
MIMMITHAGTWESRLWSVDYWSRFEEALQTHCSFRPRMPVEYPISGWSSGCLWLWAPRGRVGNVEALSKKLILYSVGCFTKLYYTCSLRVQLCSSTEWRDGLDVRIVPGKSRQGTSKFREDAVPSSSAKHMRTKPSSISLAGIWFDTWTQQEFTAFSIFHAPTQGLTVRLRNLPPTKILLERIETTKWTHILRTKLWNGRSVLLICLDNNLKTCLHLDSTFHREKRKTYPIYIIIK